MLARNGIAVTLIEMRPKKMTPAHSTGLPAELVCSNSFKSQVLPNAHGLLKEELTSLDSPLIAAARATAVSAGSALAVDRLVFSGAVDELLAAQPNITRVCAECIEPPKDAAVLIAAGPLVSDGLAAWIGAITGSEKLHFYDAVAPVIAADSIDMNIAFLASRRETVTADYINCPFTKDEYLRFFSALVEADTVHAHEFEEARFFEGCLPVEVIASRGEKALSFGPMRPIGLTDPKTGRWPYAVCQMRAETNSREAYNLVGFQTRLRIPEQERVFRMIPGLQNAEFVRWGSIHRNTYIDSPAVLNTDFSFRNRPDVWCAGQLCGNEGYTESIATGHLSALYILGRLTGKNIDLPPDTTAIGALAAHVTGSIAKSFTPSGAHFGLFPAIPKVRHDTIGKKERQCIRAQEDFKKWRAMVHTALFA